MPPVAYATWYRHTPPVAYATWVPAYATRGVCHLGVAYAGPPHPVMAEGLKGTVESVLGGGSVA